MAVCCFTKFFKCRVLDYFASSETVKEVLHCHSKRHKCLFWWSSPSNLFGCKQIGRQVDSTLFGCAAVGGRGIQHKKEYLLEDHFWRHLWKVRKNNHLSMVFLSNNHTKKKLFSAFLIFKRRERMWMVAIVPHVRFPKGNFRVTAVRGGIVLPFFPCVVFE